MQFWFGKPFDQMTINEMVDGIFFCGRGSDLRFQRMHDGVGMVTKVYYRSSHKIMEEDSPFFVYPMHLDSNDIEQVVYLIGSPLYVESLNTNCHDKSNGI